MLKQEKITSNAASQLETQLKEENGIYKINAENMHYRELNQLLRTLDRKGAEKIEIRNVYGQRYLGIDLKRSMSIDIFGTPGNDMGAFMNGQKLTVYGNAQDCSGNTMNDGQIIIHGKAGDITGYGMRGGKIFIRDGVGYRTGIHMKEYMSKKPYLVVGGTAQDFLGEYMAGGVLLVLGLTLKPGEKHKARYVGTGMHNGVMYISGEITHLGKEVKVMDVNKTDLNLIKTLAKEFCDHFNFNLDHVMAREFSKIMPVSHRPYGTVYAY